MIKQVNSHLFIWTPVLHRIQKSLFVTVCLSVSLSVHQFGIFLRNGSLVFSDFLHNGRQLKYLLTLKLTKPFFRGKIIIAKFGEKGSKIPPIFFQFFETFYH